MVASMASASNDRNRENESSPDRMAIRVLIAEDNPVNQKVASGLLGRMGCEVKVVATGRQAFEATKTAEFDLVLMDMHMPEMDGLEATELIREWETEEGRHIPIVAMTASAMEEDRAACLEAGMDAFLTKPVNLPMLKRVLAEFAERSQAA
jgi:CheY-like chemotaxis protein